MAALGRRAVGGFSQWEAGWLGQWQAGGVCEWETGWLRQWQAGGVCEWVEALKLGGLPFGGTLRGMCPQREASRDRHRRRCYTLPMHAYQI